MRYRIILPISCLVVLFAVACETTTAPGVDGTHSGGTPEEQGRRLYMNACSRCHALYMPHSYFPDEWPYYVRKYGRKARLAKGQRDLVLRYLQGASATPRQS